MTPTVPTQRDPSSALVIRDTQEMEWFAKVPIKSIVSSSRKTCLLLVVVSIKAVEADQWGIGLSDLQFFKICYKWSFFTSLIFRSHVTSFFLGGGGCSSLSSRGDVGKSGKWQTVFAAASIFSLPDLGHFSQNRPLFCLFPLSECLGRRAQRMSIVYLKMYRTDTISSTIQIFYIPNVQEKLKLRVTYVVSGSLNIWFTYSLINPFISSDVNECHPSEISEEYKNLSHNCHVDANCTNTKGSFFCTCLNGYSGDGVMCVGENQLIWKCNELTKI